MSKFIDVVKREARKAVLPTVFFLALFSMMAISKAVAIPSYEFSAKTALVIVVGALTVAKAVLVADALPFANVRSGRGPMIIAVVWKTLIFTVMVLLFRAIEELIPLLSKHDGLGGALAALGDEIHWPHFWMIQMWMCASLALYAAIVEIDDVLGAGTLRRTLFSRTSANDAGKGSPLHSGAVSSASRS